MIIRNTMHGEPRHQSPAFESLKCGDLFSIKDHGAVYMKTDRPPIIVRLPTGEQFTYDGKEIVAVYHHAELILEGCR